MNQMKTFNGERKISREVKRCASLTTDRVTKNEFKLPQISTNRNHQQKLPAVHDWNIYLNKRRNALALRHYYNRSPVSMSVPNATSTKTVREAKLMKSKSLDIYRDS